MQLIEFNYEGMAIIALVLGVAIGTTLFLVYRRKNR